MATKNKDTLRLAVPQEPTKRDKVIAQRQKQIAAGDTPLSIANQNNIPVEDLLGANPGVVTVRPGQVINIPKTGGGNMYSPTPVTNPFAGAQAFVGAGSFNSPSTNLGNYNTPYNGFQTPTTNGFQANQQQNSPALQAARTATPTQPAQPYLGSSSYMNPALRPTAQGGMSGDKQGQLGTATPPQQTAMFPTDDKGRPLPYTGDPNDPNTKLWKNYWNASAEAGVDLSGRTNAPKVMTRSEIWEMKAAQRRRRSAEQPSYSGGFQYDTTLSPLVRNITWGIRG